MAPCSLNPQTANGHPRAFPPRHAALTCAVVRPTVHRAVAPGVIYNLGW